MLFKLNKLLTNVILIIFYILNIILIVRGSSCLISYSNNISLRPNIFLKIGSQKVKLTLEDEGLRLFENQEIEAHCNTVFVRPETYDMKNKLNVKCNNRDLTINNNYYGNHQYLECSSLKWNLYETDYNFVWCPTNVTSYVLARPKELLNNNYEYLAGICYDTQNLSLKSVYYTIAPKSNNVLHPTSLADSYKPNLEVKYIKETFAMKSINKNHYNHQDVRDWIKFAQYNFTSIIQNSILSDEFNNELGSLLDFAWWPSLRLGNWKYYERALTIHIEEQHKIYDIVAGISSVAEAPIIETCKNNFTLTELRDNINHEIPMYVWNYLRSTSNNSDEIVVIGFNSPFYEFYSEKDVVFCPDICHKIPWLKKVSTNFRFSALGVMFCCTVEDVKSSKRLDGFPEINMNSKPEVNIDPKPEMWKYG